MIDSFKLLLAQKKQYIPDLKAARPGERFRGLHHVDRNLCIKCGSCRRSCESNAIQGLDGAVDLGKCTFCGNCAAGCSQHAITFTNFPHTAVDSREKLFITPGMGEDDYEKRAIECREDIVKFFGRSLKLRNVSAGGCSACELELNACGNVNFDLSRFGIDMVASPRHADGLIITGPVTENMAYALLETYETMPDPKVIIAMGTCAISGGVFAASPALKRDFFDKFKVDLYIPGCPPHPLTVINGLMKFLGH